MGHDKYIVALGLVSTYKPDMVIDIDDPVGMMTQVCSAFDNLRARNAELKEIIKSIIKGRCSYCYADNPLDLNAAFDVIKEK